MNTRFLETFVTLARARLCPSADPHHLLAFDCGKRSIDSIRDGYGVAAIPCLFVADALRSGEFIELPLQPAPPPIVVSVCRPADASPTVNAAANAAHDACSAYCRSFGKEVIEAPL